MINWKRCSHEKIKNKWNAFILARRKNPNGMKSENKSHITCLEREALIDQLIWRLDMANGVIDSYHYLKASIQKNHD